MYISQHRYVCDMTSHDSFIKQLTLGRQFGILENDINGRTFGIPIWSNTAILIVTLLLALGIFMTIRVVVVVIICYYMTVLSHGDYHV